MNEKWREGVGFIFGVGNWFDVIKRITPTAKRNPTPFALKKKALCDSRYQCGAMFFRTGIYDTLANLLGFVARQSAVSRPQCDRK